MSQSPLFILKAIKDSWLVRGKCNYPNRSFWIEFINYYIPDLHVFSLYQGNLLRVCPIMMVLCMHTRMPWDIIPNQLRHLNMLLQLHTRMKICQRWSSSQLWIHFLCLNRPLTCWIGCPSRLMAMYHQDHGFLTNIRSYSLMKMLLDNHFTLGALLHLLSPGFHLTAYNQ